MTRGIVAVKSKVFGKNSEEIEEKVKWHILKYKELKENW